MKYKVGILLALLGIGVYGVRGAINPAIVDVELDIEGVAADDGATESEWTPGGLVGVGCRKKIIVRKVQPSAWGTTVGDSYKRLRLSWASTKIKVYTSADGATDVASGTEYANGDLPTAGLELWVEGVTASSEAGTDSVPGQESILAMAIPDGDWDRIAFTVIEMDIDGDLNRDGTYDEDDDAEHTAPGLIVAVNDDDDDGDGIADMDDGYNEDNSATPSDDDVVAGENDLVVVKLKGLPQDVAAGSVVLKLASGTDKIRVWGDSGKGPTLPAAGSLPGTPSTAGSPWLDAATTEKTWTLPTDISTLAALPASVTIEGLDTGTAQLKLIYNDAAGNEVHKDTLLVTVVEVDLVGIWPTSDGGEGDEVDEQDEDASENFLLLVNGDDDNLDGQVDKGRPGPALDAEENDIATLEIKPIDPSVIQGIIRLEVNNAACIQLYDAGGNNKLTLPLELDLGTPSDSSPLYALLSGSVKFRVEGLEEDGDIVFTLSYKLGGTTIDTDEVRMCTSVHRVHGDVSYGSVEFAVVELAGAVNVVRIPAPSIDCGFLIVKTPKGLMTNNDWDTGSAIPEAVVKMKRPLPSGAEMGLLKVSNDSLGTIEAIFNAIVVRMNAYYMTSNPTYPQPDGTTFKGAFMAATGITQDDIDKGRYFINPYPLDTRNVGINRIWYAKGVALKFMGDHEVLCLRVDGDTDSNNDGVTDVWDYGEDVYEQWAPGKILRKDDSGKLTVRKALLPKIGKLVLTVSAPNTGGGAVEVYEGASTTPMSGATKEYGLATGGALPLPPDYFMVKGVTPGKVLLELEYRDPWDNDKHDEDKVGFFVTKPISWSPAGLGATAWNGSPDLESTFLSESLEKLEKQGYIGNSFFNVALGEGCGPCTFDNLKSQMIGGVVILRGHGTIGGNWFESVILGEANTLTESVTQMNAWCGNSTYGLDAGQRRIGNKVYSSVKTHASWFQSHWRAQLNARKSIVFLLACHLGIDKFVKPASGIGGRVIFAYTTRSNGDTHSANMEDLLKRMSGVEDYGGGKARCAGEAYENPNVRPYSDNGTVNDSELHMFGDGWTTLCPAPLATFPEASPVGHKGWGCIVFDTYMLTASADVLVKQTGGGASVETRKWLPPTMEDQWIVGFGYDDSGAGGITMEARGLLCRNQVTPPFGADDTRGLDGDKVAPNSCIGMIGQVEDNAVWP